MNPNPKIRNRCFFQRDPVTIARALLGQQLVRILNGQRLAGIIVETEAYLGIPDRAAHTCAGRRTPRNASMWGDGGHAYIYFTYGMHHCVNIVTDTPGTPTAVLLRALQPTQGKQRMAANRGLTWAFPKSEIRNQKFEIALCSGPARLCQALSIDRTLDGVDLVASEELFIEQTRSRTLSNHRIVAARRIGVDYAGAWARRRLRFYIKGNPYVSRTRS